MAKKPTDNAGPLNPLPLSPPPFTARERPNMHFVGDIPVRHESHTPDGVPAGADQFNIINLALSTPDSEAARSLGLEKNSLNDVQKREVSELIGRSSATPPGFFARLFDQIVTAVECLVGTFTGSCSFKDYGEKRAERTAMRTAETNYQALASHGYETLAERVSGVKPDGKGGFTPALDENHQHTGLLGREMLKITDPNKLAYFDAVDVGLAPSPVQSERTNQIYQEEVTKLYSDPEVYKRVADYREKLKTTPGKNEEVTQFLVDNKKAVEAIVDRMVDDEAIKTGGRFSYQEHRGEILYQVIGRIASEHEQKL